MIVMLEPVLLPFIPYSALTWVSTVVMTILTILSAADYMKTYWSYMDPGK